MGGFELSAKFFILSFDIFCIYTYQISLEFTIWQNDPLRKYTRR